MADDEHERKKPKSRPGMAAFADVKRLRDGRKLRGQKNLLTTAEMNRLINDATANSTLASSIGNISWGKRARGRVHQVRLLPPVFPTGRAGGRADAAARDRGGRSRVAQGRQ